MLSACSGVNLCILPNFSFGKRICQSEFSSFQTCVLRRNEYYRLGVGSNGIASEIKNPAGFPYRQEIHNDMAATKFAAIHQ